MRASVSTADKGVWINCGQQWVKACGVHALNPGFVRHQKASFTGLPSASPLRPK